MVKMLGLIARIQSQKDSVMKTLNVTTCPDSCCNNYPESMTFNDCTADATDSIAPKVPRTFPDDLDSIALIDEAIRLTVVDMPNALRLLENS